MTHRTKNQLDPDEVQPKEFTRCLARYRECSARARRDCEAAFAGRGDAVSVLRRRRQSERRGADCFGTSNSGFHLKASGASPAGLVSLSCVEPRRVLASEERH
ncbi:hypothetical protein [Sorangium sp. So ce861]|uniref:hypothetical protein n=1 Tax=Sorangium sp. So ce861 TaxID=3133323 RepID=UPI003F618CA8